MQHLVDELGVTDIVDLRTDAELHAEGPGPLVEVESLTHHHHSLIAEKRDDDADAVAAKALAVPWKDEQRKRDARFWADHYLGYLSARPDSVSAALHVVADAEGAAVVHCAAGKDRTGTVVAMALDVAGVAARGHRRRLRAHGRADRADHRPADAAAGLRRGAGQAEASTSRCPGPSRSRRSSPPSHEGYGRRRRLAGRPRLERRGGRAAAPPAHRAGFSLT